ncbi:V-type proton ATPase subunit a2 [Camellia lanceoleosa]|uniref:V-type proton ATPase subunit a2 n=1 Tax=Camellia lanceoleosa TaxID=1840588 RepID=A0ACC0GI74_9ERIC|nr:V-type proton ATPase subunit a2 [Camellia lanceoleosa]
MFLLREKFGFSEAFEFIKEKFGVLAVVSYFGGFKSWVDCCQASDFLVSSKSHAVKEEKELDDHVYSNDVYADTTSLLDQVEKIVFVVFFLGKQAKTKTLKICEAFGAIFYFVLEDIMKQRPLTQEIGLVLKKLFEDGIVKHEDLFIISKLWFDFMLLIMLVLLIFVV